MLALDGSTGGGQLVRTALSLAALTGESFRMTDVRDARSEPGLRPQHLAAVRVLSAVTDADVSGADLGSTSFRFDPDQIRPGRYEVAIGTAGSVVLLFDALLPLAVALQGRLAVRATGGTDVAWAPTMDYLRRVKLPLLRGHGVGATVDLTRRGFYPAGGGEATLSVFPSAPEPFDLPPAGQPETAWVRSVASTDLSDAEVAERQAAAAIDGLSERDVDVGGRVVEYAAARSTGSAVAVALDCGTSVVGGDAIGERGTPADEVGERAVDRAVEAIQVGGAVDVHMADQLLPFVALVGGRLPIPAATEHVEAARTLLDEFGFAVRLDERGELPVVEG